MTLRTSAAVAALAVMIAPLAATADNTAGYYPPKPPVPRRAPVEDFRVGSGAADGQVLRVDLAASNSRQLQLPRGKSAIIELPVDVRDLLVSNPKVADAVLRSPRRIFVLGTEIGQTDAVFFDAAGRRILTLDIKVDQDTNALRQTISRVLPGSRVEAEALNDSVILTGQVMTAADADKAGQIAASFVAGPTKVLNMLSIAGKDQVMLQVRIVEMQRNIIKQLGMSTNLLFNDGSQSYSLGRTNTFAINGGLLGGASACAGRDTTRTTNYTNNNNSTNQTSTTSGTNSSNTSTTNSGTTSGTSNSNTSGTTNSTSNSATFNGSFPGTVDVLDVNGNTVTLAGTTVAAVARNAGANAATTNAITDGVSNAVTNAVTGGVTNGSSNALSNLISNAASTAYSAMTGSAVNGCLQAFERVGLVRTLAEPNLTVVSGEAGKFLVGGEFPVPTGQDTTGKVTLEFKPYGVGLGYTPVVLSGGRISIKLSTEVSELSNAGAFFLTAGNSTLTVPGLSVRRAETTAELPSGGSLMIAGLLQQQTKQNLDALPGMTALPVLGSLFRSRDYLNGETELVVIITAYIVDPVHPHALQTPVDGLKIASDSSTVLLGKLNKVVRTKTAPAGATPYQGPVGYVIE